MTMAASGLRELLVVWIPKADGSLRMAWTEETPFVDLTDLKARGYGR
jgi:hypothetical protein